MIITTHNEPKPEQKLIHYLMDEFTLTEEAINLGIKQSELEAAPISIILKHLGLISLEQYQLFIDWLNTDI